MRCASSISYMRVWKTLQRGITRVVAPTLRRRRSNIGGPCPLSNAPLPTVRYEQNCLLMPPKERSPRRSEPRTITPSRFRIGKNILPVGSHYHPGSQNLLSGLSKAIMPHNNYQTAWSNSANGAPANSRWPPISCRRVHNPDRKNTPYLGLLKVRGLAVQFS